MLSDMSVPRPTLCWQVCEQLGQDICAGRFASGEVLPPEPALCERFNVSRIVVREAVKSLAAKGVLDVRRKTGTVVQPQEHWQLFDPDIVAWRVQAATLDARFAADLMELRRVVEPQAARFAAERITEDEIRAMRSAFDAMAAAVAGQGEYVPADLAFHAVILAACHNQFLRQMQGVLSVILRTSFTLSSRVPGGPARSLPLHEALCDAIEARDPDAAERAVVALIERAGRDLHAVISPPVPVSSTTPRRMPSLMLQR